MDKSTDKRFKKNHVKYFMLSLHYTLADTKFVTEIKVCKIETSDSNLINVQTELMANQEETEMASSCAIKEICQTDYSALKKHVPVVDTKEFSR